ncbi:hypothetical protein MED121_06885 [Marinomonas sp. MED121]|uniref:hypothetical protein n=1 Tax=Marinomonas sp. MED121 TaxID=314277 RepID=UPI00006903AD|nr:hypothetical protein [Marinomonas sp. MED121]EAQ66388.1 hypothetical protein MED121_06885 [Marinomonas sp. MED121]
MKFLSIFVLLFISACSGEKEINKAITEAKINKDFRLLSLGGRVPNFPGVEPKELEMLLNICGKRIIENTSDFIQQGENLDSRKAAFQFASEYNQQIKALCIKHYN